MGWEVGDHGFRLVLDADLTSFVEEVLAGDIRAFLAGRVRGMREA